MARFALLALCLVVALPAAPVGAQWLGLKTEYLVALLSGAAAVPAPADTGASGVATLALTTKAGVADSLSYQITVSNLKGGVLPVAQHIHSGNATSTGGVVVAFTGNWTAVPGVPGVITLGGKITNGTLLKVFTTLTTGILSAPLNYYVNVHTPAFGAGAVRGQIFYNAGFV